MRSVNLITLYRMHFRATATFHSNTRYATMCSYDDFIAIVIRRAEHQQRMNDGEWKMKQMFAIKPETHSIKVVYCYRRVHDSGRNKSLNTKNRYRYVCHIDWDGAREKENEWASIKRAERVESSLLIENNTEITFTLSSTVHLVLTHLYFVSWHLDRTKKQFQVNVFVFSSQC